MEEKSYIINRLLQGKFTLIAEIGVNYYDIARERAIPPMEAAKLMIDEAAHAGIHAVKFQTYRAQTLAAADSPSYWDLTEESTRSQRELFKKFDSFGYPEYLKLSAHAKAAGIEFLSTPFDFESADYLNEMMEVYKISSSDLSNIPFIEHQAKKDKPILLSTGASNLPEIERAVDTIRKFNERPLALLHCVLQYPTHIENANLNKIITLKEQFPDLIIGYSDHTKPTPEFEVITTAYNLGALCVEKHFTLDKTLKGNDHYHAMDPDEARQILSRIEHMDVIRGSYELSCLECESAARENARRSIVTAVDIAAGTVITEQMLTFKRPGKGISPDRMEEVCGKVAAVDLKEDTILMEDMLKEAVEEDM